MFFFPLRDDNNHNIRPIITYIIFALCVVVFFWQLSIGINLTARVFGMTPLFIFGDSSPLPLPAWMTIISSLFLHGGFLHLAGNMLYLWIFADNVEACMGWAKFIMFYILCGVAAALTQAGVNLTSEIPLIGASGAIAGVLGAYLLLYPRANVRCVVGFFIFFKMVRVPAFLVLGVWIVLQFYALGQLSDASGGGVAYLAHIGGFVAGMVLIPFFKSPDVRLFSPAHSRAFEVSPIVARTHIPHIGKRPDNQSRNPWGEG
ncbi:MAG: rhomboid family intramembrane serine protease [Alphaproteobacteria bacterium]|nr:rhomboid family intramembrane serine protease [Alphaproteobacteria bacterium]